MQPQCLRRACSASLLIALSVVPAVHELRAAADAAVLAAADTAQLFVDRNPCDSARKVVESVRAELTSCGCVDGICAVALASNAALFPISVTARAG